MTKNIDLLKKYCTDGCDIYYGDYDLHSCSDSGISIWEPLDTENVEFIPLAEIDWSEMRVLAPIDNPFDLIYPEQN